MGAFSKQIQLVLPVVFWIRTDVPRCVVRISQRLKTNLPECCWMHGQELSHSQIKFRHLRSIQFNLSLREPKELNVIDWNWISNAFQYPSFLTLWMVQSSVLGHCLVWSKL